MAGRSSGLLVACVLSHAFWVIVGKSADGSTSSAICRNTGSRSSLESSPGGGVLEMFERDRTSSHSSREKRQSSSAAQWPPQPLPQPIAPDTASASPTTTKRHTLAILRSGDDIGQPRAREGSGKRQRWVGRRRAFHSSM